MTNAKIDRNVAKLVRARVYGNIDDTFESICNHCAGHCQHSCANCPVQATYDALKGVDDTTLANAVAKTGYTR